MQNPHSCPVCGETHFTQADVLWPQLVDAWQLRPDEAAYVNRQQGLCCDACGNNMRSMSLAAAILHAYRFGGTLREFVGDEAGQKLKVLEINHAGKLTPTLQALPLHVFARYPEYDMCNLALESGSFDLVVHSDTLEHVPDPVRGLAECRRVLAPSGRCIFTVPIIVDRFTRSRQGLEPSSHGVSDDVDDCLVHTEFGADAWKYAAQAGFTSVRLHSFEYPAAIAIDASSA